ncbi:MAG: sporulation protein YqfC [Firmicutes bacterium]|nr:sporulation protein YqfC [Bacillota bacterium]
MGRQRARALRSELADFFELPKDILLDLPRITLLGNLRLVIENHRGLIQYEPVQIRVCLEKGEVVLQGSNLNISLISKEEIVIDGQLKGVEFHD